MENYPADVREHTLLDFSEYLPCSDLTDYENRTVEESRQAFHQRQQEDIIHDQIQTDSESDDPEAWLGVQNVLSPKGQALIRKQRAIIQRQAKRQMNKEIATRHIKKKAFKKVSRTLAKYLNLGRDIEEYVKSKRIGADQWRRTGVLTFDSNVRKNGPKVTYRRIQKHLEGKYKSKLGCGTMDNVSLATNVEFQPDDTEGLPK